MPANHCVFSDIVPAFTWTEAGNPGVYILTWGGEAVKSPMIVLLQERPACVKDFGYRRECIYEV